MNKETTNLLKRLPKVHHAKVELLEREEGLIDDCRYMLCLASGYHFNGETGCFPVMNMKEAIAFVKDTESIEGE